MSAKKLIAFLTQKMSMTDVYQPAVIRELLLHGGTRTKAELAAAISQYDLSVQEYYERIVMRWPRLTLRKHGIIDYERRGSVFHLVDYPHDEAGREEAVRICDTKIWEWTEKKRLKEKAPEAGASVRYEVLKAAGGKCELCGISAQLRPIDIDHIVPRARANKNGKVRKDGKLIDVNDRENLQALCFACNRAKRATDETDFRRKSKLVRDRIPEIIRAEGRSPAVRQLEGPKLTAALYDKLVEEHAELIAETKSEAKLAELADMIEVIFAIGKRHGAGQEELLALTARKRADRGGFDAGYFYMGDAD